MVLVVGMGVVLGGVDPVTGPACEQATSQSDPTMTAAMYLGMCHVRSGHGAQFPVLWFFKRREPPP